MNLPRLTRVALAATAMAAALSGCVVAPARPYYGGYAYGGPVVTVAPPPPEVEVVGVAPFPGAFWVGGYWGWNAGRHVWVRGRWEAPRPGYRWEPHMWHREGQGWREAPGRWAPQ